MIALIISLAVGSCSPAAPLRVCAGPSNITVMRADARGTYSYVAHVGTLTVEG